ncbi:S8 family peptidase [Teredinibacter turnerae]|uniref:S8 family peptidase n=1 Tax=Teredinibacter turnerae TaxID=2426 RepID=UPI000372A9C1|nr:S8 family peptidase [Teredinibacter turnerae]
MKKNPILSNGEAYVVSVKRKQPPPGDKIHPYDFSQAQKRITPKIMSALSLADKLPPKATPNGKIVTSLTLHPSYLAKSFFPDKLLKDYNLKNIGSKEVFIEPEVKVSKEQKKGKISSSLYFISGKKENFLRLLNDVQSGTINEDARNDFVKIEDFAVVKEGEKINSNDAGSEHDACYEIVLHASQDDHDVVSSFYDYLAEIGAHIFLEKTRSINGLTFCFVRIKPSEIAKLVKFVFVRIVRPLPNIKLSDRIGHDKANQISNLQLQNVQHSDTRQSKVAVFDAGLLPDALDNKNIRYFDLTNSSTDDESNLIHGTLVSSSVVYGEAEKYQDENNTVVPIDHFKVYCQSDQADIGLVEVLDRITSILTQKKYKFVNISLGPEYPCSDSEPSVWTATLDKIAESGDTLIVVAAGNSGEFGDTFNRIQPPSDMLNGICIGAASSKGKDWDKASYSSVGPGRRPGFIKPDALYFGGEKEGGGAKLNIINIADFSVEQVFGTSFSAPLVTRLAALLDAYTGGKFSAATIRALIIHSTKLHARETKDCGWGLIDGEIDNLLFCSDKKVTLIYQGKLENLSGVRAAIPYPTVLNNLNKRLKLESTICFFTEIDPHHTVSYTKAGIEATFRPHFDRFNLNKETGELSSEAATRSLFTRKKVLGSEQTLRKDSHKWETCYKVYDKINLSTLNSPVLDLKYLTRDEGHPLSASEIKNLAPLHYSLIVTLDLNSDVNLYEEILAEYNLLVPVDINVDVNLAT